LIPASAQPQQQQEHQTSPKFHHPAPELFTGISLLRKMPPEKAQPDRRRRGRGN